MRRLRAVVVAAVRDDEGSMLPLIAFFVFLGLVVVLVVTAATSLYLEKKRLFTVADGAALVGAEAFELDTVSLTASGPRPVIVSRDVAEAVAAYLDGNPVAGFEGLAVDAAHSVDGRSATVTLSALWQPPVVTLLVPDGIRIEATATARSVFD